MVKTCQTSASTEEKVRHSSEKATTTYIPNSHTSRIFSTKCTEHQVYHDIYPDLFYNTKLKHNNKLTESHGMPSRLQCKIFLTNIEGIITKPSKLHRTM